LDVTHSPRNLSGAGQHDRTDPPRDRRAESESWPRDADGGHDEPFVIEDWRGYTDDVFAELAVIDRIPALFSQGKILEQSRVLRQRVGGVRP
jgi:hypothetical protein